MFSQDLIYNGGFEDINTCIELNSWCGAEAWLRNPLRKSGRNIAKAKGYEKVRQGSGSENIVVENTNRPIKNRVFIYSMLKCELLKGEKYNISLWLNPLKNRVLELDVLLTDHELVPGVKNPLTYWPSFSLGVNNISSKERQWTNYIFEYTAKGGERFITIGNFDKKVYCPDKKLIADNKAGDIMYFIDDVSVSPADEFGIQDCDSTGIRKLLYSFNYRHSYRIGLNYKMGLEHLESKSKITQQNTSIKTIEIPDIAFDFDSYKISKDYLSRIDSIFQYIKSINPQRIEIIGHTDDIGNDAYNQKLSLQRAAEVKSILVSQNQDIDLLTSIKGNGEDTPKVENNSKENRKINRRVEIRVTTKTDD